MRELSGLRAFYARDRAARVASTVLLLSKPIADGLRSIRTAWLDSGMGADHWFMRIVLWKHLPLVASAGGLVLLVVTIARELEAVDAQGR
jgi:hypothetical protein